MGKHQVGRVLHLSHPSHSCSHLHRSIWPALCSLHGVFPHDPRSSFLRCGEELSSTSAPSEDGAKAPPPSVSGSLSYPREPNCAEEKRSAQLPEVTVELLLSSRSGPRPTPGSGLKPGTGAGLGGRPEHRSWHSHELRCLWTLQGQLMLSSEVGFRWQTGPVRKTLWSCLVSRPPT